MAFLFFDYKVRKKCVRICQDYKIKFQGVRTRDLSTLNTGKHLQLFLYWISNGREDPGVRSGEVKENEQKVNKPDNSH